MGRTKSEPRRRSRRGRVLPARAAVVALAALVAMPAPASAAPSPVYAAWTLTGTGGSFTGTMTLAAGFPAASFTSDSRAPTQLPTGASTWIPAATPFGALFGSSQGHAYVNLRPAADTATGPSTTTYTFVSPTPTAGWGFALGDIDADQVQVSATDANHNPVPSAALGFQGVFNYCDATPRSPACTGVVAPFDLPTWQPATATLVGNPGAIDTVGASGWFEPTVGLSTLTFRFTRRAGLPVYQTWFASVTRSISGTVTLDGGGETGVTVTVQDPGGKVLATTTSDSTGKLVFDGLGPGAGYSVTITPPAGQKPIGPTSRTIDLTNADATAVDFPLITVFDVPGTITGPSNEPVPGANVDLEDPGGAILRSTTTDSSGGFVLTEVPAGVYVVVVTPPGNLVPQTTSVTVPLPPGQILGIQVASAATPTTSPTSPTSPTSTTSTIGGAPARLPATGTDTGSVAELAALVALSGAAIVTLARRRSART